jgi:hypothetical protein
VLHPKFTVPLLSSVPSVMVLHGADWFLPDAAHFYGRLDRAYMHVFMPLYLRRAAGIISVSQLTTDDFERIFTLPRARSEPCTSAQPATSGASPTRRLSTEVRRRYGLPDRFIFTLSKVGGGERKNIGGVFKAYRTCTAACRTSWSSAARAASVFAPTTIYPATAGAATCCSRVARPGRSAGHLQRE